MSSISSNLSDRIFFTLNYTSGTGRIGELEIKDGHKKQEILVRFSHKELVNLMKLVFECGDSILHEKELKELAQILEHELSKGYGLGKYV